MTIIKRRAPKSGPKVIKRDKDVKTDKYPVRKFSRKEDDFREERREERSERKPYARSFDSFEKKPYSRSFDGFEKKGGYEKKSGFEKKHDYEKWEDRTEPRPYRSRPSSFRTSDSYEKISSPAVSIQTVTPYKLKKGLVDAREEISSMIETLREVLSDSHNVKEAELTVSFNADGKLMGFGAGGAATIKIKVSLTE